MNWMEEHAELIVEPLRDCRYQARARAELMDHMDSLYQSCLEQGMSEAEARGEALIQLGSVRQLRREYRQAELVLRSQSLSFCISRIWLGGLSDGNFVSPGHPYSWTDRQSDCRPPCQRRSFASGRTGPTCTVRYPRLLAGI